MPSASQATSRLLLQSLRSSIVELHRLKGVTQEQFISPNSLIVKEMQIWLTAIAYVTRKIDGFFQGATDRDFEVSHMQIQFILKKDLEK